MNQRPLGRTGLNVSELGFGAFKIGRNQGAKYPAPYDLPDDTAVAQLVRSLLDLGINYFDTAPAYGISEERLGPLLGALHDVVISTKVGETFESGRSTHDYSAGAIKASVQQSRRRLNRDVLDLVLIHSDGRDLEILDQTDVVDTLQRLKAAGAARAIGLSGKTVAGAERSLEWADVLMVEYHPDDVSHAGVIAKAAELGRGVLIKKGLASGRLPAAAAIPFILQTPGVSSLVVGGLNAVHFQENARHCSLHRSA